VSCFYVFYVAKGTNKRGINEIKTPFYFFIRAEVTSAQAKVTISLSFPSPKVNEYKCALVVLIEN
jgi:hypothetical protein